MHEERRSKNSLSSTNQDPFTTPPLSLLTTDHWWSAIAVPCSTTNNPSAKPLSSSFNTKFEFILHSLPSFLPSPPSPPMSLPISQTIDTRPNVELLKSLRVRMIALLIGVLFLGVLNSSFTTVYYSSSSGENTPNLPSGGQASLKDGDMLEGGIPLTAKEAPAEAIRLRVEEMAGLAVELAEMEGTSTLPSPAEAIRLRGEDIAGLAVELAEMAGTSTLPSLPSPSSHSGMTHSPTTQTLTLSHSALPKICTNPLLRARLVRSEARQPPPRQQPQPQSQRHDDYLVIRGGGDHNPWLVLPRGPSDLL